MNPHQKNKVDISTLSPDEQRLFRLYGKLPTKKDLLQNKLKERKYFDSGDYALSKAGKASDIGVTSIGREHPQPENIPHIAPPAHAHNGLAQNGQEKAQGGVSPIKEHSFLHRETSLNRETSADDLAKEEQQEGSSKA
ncbi:putative camp-regulated phospho protein family protein Igo1 [Clohesyomyces aquaticus]|uniref:mRNA stability protein n=1 Tax=Clohesyomyces aquaticus TaxID=1231657 RepID=A0A1Y1ZL06_9PLEO|nr:putative camp-regulated phospho protein family protein Igo1 [Clohesyomyces aquaticus]